MKSAKDWAADAGQAAMQVSKSQIQSELEIYFRKAMAEALRWSRNLCIERMNSFSMDSNFYTVIQDIGRAIEDKAFVTERGDKKVQDTVEEKP